MTKFSESIEVYVCEMKMQKELSHSSPSDFCDISDWLLQDILFFSFVDINFYYIIQKNLNIFRLSSFKHKKLKIFQEIKNKI